MTAWLSDPSACHWTGQALADGEAIGLGAIMPGVKGVHPSAPTEEAKAARKASFVAFAESERNCNTCRQLQRIRHEKCRHGWIDAICITAGDTIRFHPDDPMDMSCYESRYEGADA